MRGVRGDAGPWGKDAGLRHYREDGGESGGIRRNARGILGETLFLFDQESQSVIVYLKISTKLHFYLRIKNEFQCKHYWRIMR